MTTATDARFEERLPLDQLHESPLNPRKFYDPVKQADLTTSIRAKGVITPLLVRPNASGFEIAAGHRRYRSAKAAELVHVPAVVREMDDVTFLEILIFENDEREDLHPLEEADGYRTLMTRAGYSVERIAERRGCSVKWVYDRVKLLSLIPEAQRLFRANKFTAGHAILLARLKPEDQKRAIGSKDDDFCEGGLFAPERTLWDPNDEGAGKESFKPVSVRELEAWIDEHVRFDAKLVDSMLFEQTAAVVARAQEAEETIVKITHEHFIPEEARDAKERTYGPRSWKRADGQYKSKPCEFAVTGVVVVGPERGEAFKVCINKEKCKTHWAAEQREKQKRAASTSTSDRDRWAREEEKRKAEQAKRDAERARWKKALPKILEAVAAAVKKAPTRAGGLLGEILIEECADSWQDKGGKKAAEYLARGTTADDLVRHAVFIVLYKEAAVDYGAPERFPKRAKAFGVDVAKILAEVALPAKAETSATKPAQTSAAKKRKPS
jgi:ParB family chromosome partitioning protein